MSGIPSWAVKGAKCVCTDASGFDTDWHGKYPALNGIYTISGFDTVFGGFTFVEIPGDACWSYWRFRPLVTLEDDISTHFRQLLDVPAHHGADA